VTDEQLRRRRVASQLGFLAVVGRGSVGARTVDGPGLLGSICPARPDRSIVNAVAYTEPAALIGAIDDLAAAYQEAGIEAWTVWVPEADREVAAALAAAGHVLDGVPRDMAAVLTDLDLEPRVDLDLDPEPAWLDVAEVNEAAYARSAGGAYFGPSLQRMEGRAYIARLDGRPASCLAVFDVDDDAYVGLVATRPEARRRGLARELLRRALREAAARGMVTTTLEATAAGAPVYARLGYRDLGIVEMWERRLRNDSPQPG
jgi:ribosomal protein S18 acetylase RimI-like enzyme